MSDAAVEAAYIEGWNDGHHGERVMSDEWDTAPVKAWEQSRARAALAARTERRTYWAVASGEDGGGYWNTEWAEFYDSPTAGDLMTDRSEADWRVSMLREQGKQVCVVQVEVTVREVEQ